MKKPKVKPEVYREFVKQVELGEIYLRKASIEVFREKVPKNFAVLNKIGDDVKLVGEESGHFQVSHRFRYKMVDENDQNVIIAKINLELLLIYSSDKPINKDIFDVFKILNVPLVSWPYAREFIHNTLMRLGLPPVILPLYKNAAG
jgi:preprotein translocase subunit SecB